MNLAQKNVVGYQFNIIMHYGVLIRGALQNVMRVAVYYSREVHLRS